MMFDNSPPVSLSTMDNVKAHVPILLAVGGAMVLFVSMHTGAFTVAVLAILHLVLGLVMLLIRSLRQRNGSDQ